jgi:hypothetical protein
MNHDQLLVLIAVFTGIAALALLFQSIAFLAMARSVRQISSRMDRLGADVSKAIGTVTTKAEELLSLVKGVVERIHTLENSLNATSAVIQKRVVELDSFLEETTDTARLQVLRVQAVVENISSRVEETFDRLHQSVLAPVNEITAIIRGIRVGLDFLQRHRKPPGRASHQDDEMFI